MHIIITPYTNQEKGKAGKIHDKIKIKKPVCCDNIIMKDECARKETCTLSIHTQCKKKDGSVITVDDLPDNMGFGNGITCLGGGLMLKSGEKVPCVIAIFEDDVGITCDDVEKIMRE